MGLDPNGWFGNVEIVAAKRIGRETVQYVSNIYKYYIAYRLTRDKRLTATVMQDGQYLQRRVHTMAYRKNVHIVPGRYYQDPLSAYSLPV